MEERIQLVIDAFHSLHNNEQITEEQMQDVKDLICGNALFSNILMEDQYFWLLINSTLDNIHENYQTVLDAFIKKAFCLSNGIRY